MVGWDGLGRIWAGGGFELVQAGLGLASRVGGGLVYRCVVRGPRWQVRFGRARVTNTFLGRFREQTHIFLDRPDSR